MKEKIVFFGAGPYVSQIIEILGREFEIVATISSNEKLDDKLFDELKSTGAKVAVLASFGKIIPDKYLNLFEFGILNIHPSLLPKFRGTTPVQSAILSGETKTGVTIIKLDNEVDHGPILAVADYPITEADTAESLYNILFKLGADLLIDSLPKYLSGQLTPVEQNHENATYTEPLTRESGFLDLNQESGIMNHEKISRMIRAYYKWPGVWFKAKLNGNEKIIKLLPKKMIQVEGKNPKTPKDFTNGYPEGKEILTKLGLN